MKNFVKPLWLLTRRHKKKLMIMRNALLLILLSAFQVLASSSYSQTKKLSVNLEEATVKQVLAAVEEQSDFYFLYNSELINVDKKVSVAVEDETVNSVLDQLFDKNEVGVLINDKYIILTPKTADADDQKSVTGKITDQNGDPLIGVTVLEKGTTHGTITNMDGTYTISDLGPNAVLVFSFIGMESQEIAVGNQTTINITLSSDAIGLEEVVVTALGIKR